MKNISLEKSYTKCDEETSPRPFSNKSKLSTSLDQQSKNLYTLFLLYVWVKNYRDILTVWCRSLAFGSLPYFLHDFLTKICYILLTCQTPFSDSLLEILENMCIIIFLTYNFPSLQRHKFENKLKFSYEAVFSYYQKTQDKNLNISRPKRTFKII